MLFLAGELFVLGKVVDTVHLKKAYRLPQQGIFAISLLLLWIILDAGTEVFLKRGTLDWFLGSIVFSFAALWLVFRFTKSVDIRSKITKLLVELPVYSRDGKWVGKVETVNKEKGTIDIKENKTKQNKTVGIAEFHLLEGRIVLTK